MTFFFGDAVYFIGGISGTIMQTGTPTPENEIKRLNLSDLSLEGSGLWVPDAGGAPLLNAALAAMVPADGGTRAWFVVGGALGHDAVDQVLVVTSATDGGLGAITNAGVTLGTARQGASAYTDGTNLYVYGGFDTDGNVLSTSEVAAVTGPASIGSFSSGTATLGQAFATTALAGPNTFFVGGVTLDGGGQLSASSIYDVMNPDVPHASDSSLPTGVALPAAVSLEAGKFSVIGGFTPAPAPAMFGPPVAVRDLQVVNVAPGQAADRSDNPSALNVARGAAFAVCTGSTLYVIGGVTNPNDGGLGLVTTDSVETMSVSCPQVP